MSKIPFKMIFKKLFSGSTITLDDIFKNLKSFPLYFLSGGRYTRESVTEAILYLEEIGGGTVTIPDGNGYHKTVIDVISTGVGYKTKFTYYDFQCPLYTAQTTRPYLGTDWEVGDMVYNLDYPDNQNGLYWVCLGSGSPGTWDSQVKNMLLKDHFTISELNSSTLRPGYFYNYRYHTEYCSPSFMIIANIDDYPYDYMAVAGNGYVDIYFSENITSDLDVDLYLCGTVPIGTTIPDSEAYDAMKSLVFGVSSFTETNEYVGYPYRYRYGYASSTENLIVYAESPDYKFDFFVVSKDGYIDFYFPENITETITLNLLIIGEASDVEEPVL